MYFEFPNELLFLFCILSSFYLNICNTESLGLDGSLLNFNVFDWVFSDNNDEQEMEEHFGYLRGNKDDADLLKMAKLIGIRPEFFNFKAHDYDDNDKLDGLELLSMITIEKQEYLIKERENLNSLYKQEEQKNYIELCSKIIDRLFQQEDINNDGYLDFTEYSKAKLRIEKIN